VKAFFSRTEEAIEKLNGMFGEHGEQMSSKFLGNFVSSYFVNIDAGTREYHTEMDLTYTFIVVPRQVHVYEHDVKFSFLLSENKKFNIKMHEGVSMIYSAYLLTHRQECKSRNGFINFSAFMDKRFIQNLNKSIKRRSNAIS
jgi:hypothetical protein